MPVEEPEPLSPGMKLRRARESRSPSVTQEQAAQSLEVLRSTYAAWEAGRNDPPTKVVRAASELWGLPLEWFFDGHDTPVPESPTVKVAESKAQPTGDLDRPRWLVSYQPLQMRFAGVVPAASDWGDPLASEEFIEVDARYEHPRRFAAQLVGSSCWPALHQGDLTIWHSDEAPASGLIILAQNLPEHQCTVKQLRLDDQGQAQLVPVNPNEKAPPIGDAGWYPIARLVAVVRAAGRVERSWYNPAGLRAEDLE